jgi:hypothetical protein
MRSAVALLAEKSQVRLTFLAQLSDEAGVGVGETIAEFFKLLMSNLEIPSGFDGAPALLKLKGIDFAEMRFGVALHGHGAELTLGVGKQTLRNGQKPGKIIVHQDEHPTETTFQQAA